MLRFRQKQVILAIVMAYNDRGVNRFRDGIECYEIVETVRRKFDRRVGDNDIRGVLRGKKIREYIQEIRDCRRVAYLPKGPAFELFRQRAIETTPTEFPPPSSLGHDMLPTMKLVERPEITFMDAIVSSLQEEMRYAEDDKEVLQQLLGIVNRASSPAA